MKATLGFLKDRQSSEKAKDQLETIRLQLAINVLLLQSNLLKKAHEGKVILLHLTHHSLFISSFLFDYAGAS